MKLALGLLLVVVVGLVVAVKFGFTSMDPAKQGEQLKTDVKAGMTCYEVFDKFPPKRMVGAIYNDRGFLVDSPEIKVERSQFETNFKAGAYNLGFKFIYIYGAESQWEVVFDPEGKVLGVEKRLTMGDLLGQ